MMKMLVDCATDCSTNIHTCCVRSRQSSTFILMNFDTEESSVGFSAAEGEVRGQEEEKEDSASD